MWIGNRQRRRLGAMIPYGFEAFDDDQIDIAPREVDVGTRFRELPQYKTFNAGGRVWAIWNTMMGHNVRLVVDTEDPKQAAHWAEVVGDEIVISALSKRSPARPVGKPVARTKTL